MKFSSSTAVRALIVFSVLITVLPIFVFYSIYNGVFDWILGWNSVSNSTRGLVSALTAVGIVNLIVFLFVFVAFKEEESEAVETEETKKEV